MPSGTTEITGALEILRRDPLRNVVLLKFLDMTLGSSTLHQAVDGHDVASLLLVDHRFSSFDRKAYPAARVSAIISSTRPELTRKVLAFAPRGETLVFKLTDEADRLVVAEEFPLKRQTAYHSYTASAFAAAAPGADVEFPLSDSLSRMFAAQDHDPEWLGSLIDSGRAFVSAVKEDGQPLSACFAFQIDGAIWGNRRRLHGSRKAWRRAGIASRSNIPGRARASCMRSALPRRRREHGVDQTGGDAWHDALSHADPLSQRGLSRRPVSIFTR